MPLPRPNSYLFILYTENFVFFNSYKLPYGYSINSKKNCLFHRQRGSTLIKSFEIYTVNDANFPWLKNVHNSINECGLAYIWNTQTFINRLI